MRIVGGALKGRVLAAPKSMDIRPTSDRLRESLFNILEHNYDILENARVLDLFAGTGALGFEALSRGASHACLVDMSLEGRGLIRTTIENLGLANKALLMKRDATKLGACHPLSPFSLVFCDPPYGNGLAEQALLSAFKGGWFAPECLIIVEESAKALLEFSETFEVLEERVMGDTKVYFLKLATLTSF